MYEGRGARTWLLSIVRNTCYTWLAKNRPQNLLLVGALSDVDEINSPNALKREPFPTPETELIQKAEAAAVWAALEAVPHPFREVLVLRDVNELSYKEIATMLTIPIGTVMSRLARGRAHLAAAFESPDARPNA